MNIGSNTGNHEKTQFLTDYIFAVMFLRLSFLFKAYFNFSGFKTQFVKKICKENGFKPSNWFILKLRLVR